MNYIVEDNFDFYSELNSSADQVPEKGQVPEKSPQHICMISHEPLTYNALTLSCKHTFNYLPLYNELCQHNNKQSINCPYCRSKSEKLIPFIPLPGVTKIYGVNYPTKWCMPMPKCVFIIKTGMYKGLACEHNGVEYEHGTFCSKHVNYNIDTTWTTEKAALFKTKSVPELKAMLRAKGLKVGGVKKDLVNRLLEIVDVKNTNKK
jgi:hypothetical protein